MNDSRRNLVIQAFKNMDKENAGQLDIHLLQECFNAKAHPEVKNGRKNEDDVELDFLESFEAHHSAFVINYYYKLIYLN